MQQERYEMARGHLSIVDPELEVNIQESFSLPLLPVLKKPRHYPKIMKQFGIEIPKGF